MKISEDVLENIGLCVAYLLNDPNGNPSIYESALIVEDWLYDSNGEYAETPDAPRCEGSSRCTAPLHVHGCYADLDGSACDDPDDHYARQTLSEQR